MENRFRAFINYLFSVLGLTLCLLICRKIHNSNFSSFSNLSFPNIFIFFVAQSANFFPEFNIRLYDKNSESDYFFLPPPKSEYFFQQHWESEYFFMLNGHSHSAGD